MLYPRCPTCGFILSTKQLPFEQMVDDIMNSSLPQKEKDAEKAKVLDKLNIKRYCCRARVLTYVDKVRIVK